ncbi:phosphate signaling complex protein PhoU [Flavihumibacter sp. R14]|nr:phosphate signaling complex protein PhoU [Flavihumibacter soli]
MTHLDTELQQLKDNLIEMWTLVKNQLSKAQEALFNNDKDLAREVVSLEKRVNAFELGIDQDCENIFALFNPVAVDLRLVLAIIKINNNLERQGDSAKGVAKFVIEFDGPFDKHLLDITRITEMFTENITMLDELTEAFEKEDGVIARKTFKRDELLDEINDHTTAVVAEYIRKNLENTEQALQILSIIRKLERSGDHSKNIAEEIIFYTEAKVLKHKGKDKK